MIFSNPLQEVWGGLGYEFLNFEMFEPDGEKKRSLKEELVERIKIEGIFILLKIIYGNPYDMISTMMG